MRTILITGGAGFIGSNFIKQIQKNNDYFVINLDKLTYAGNLENLNGVKQNYKFIEGDIAEKKDVNSLRIEDIEYIINFAAESHVDRSIDYPDIFTITNVLGTQILLKFALENNIRKFIQISTDEVYGSLEKTGKFKENSPINPSSPYSASKAAADLLVSAFHKTYGLNTVIVRCSNNYGPHQFPEKLIPKMIHNALNNRPLPIYGDGRNIRDWIFVEDHCRAIQCVLEKGRNGEIYNIGGNAEKQNIEIAEIILKELGKPLSLIKFTADRKAHDKRYAVDFSKIYREMNWQPTTDFTEGLKNTIAWYMQNRDWLDNIFSGKYRNMSPF